MGGSHAELTDCGLSSPTQRAMTIKRQSGPSAPPTLRTRLPRTPALMSQRTILCFAGDTWEGNPHSRHHLMRRFARAGWNVLFVEGIPMRSVVADGRNELRRVAAKLRAPAGTRTVEDRLHVLRPLPIPPTGEPGRRAQLAMLRLQIGWTRRRLGLDGPTIAWYSLPNAAPLMGRLGEAGFDPLLPGSLRRLQPRRRRAPAGVPRALGDRMPGHRRVGRAGSPTTSVRSVRAPRWFPMASTSTTSRSPGPRRRGIWTAWSGR